MPVDIIKKNFERNIQHVRTPDSKVLKTNYKYSFLNLNDHRRHEKVAADKFCCDNTAAEDGSASAQIFVAKDTLLTEVYVIKYDEQFSSTLSDNIRQCSNMFNITSNRTQAEIRNKVQGTLRVSPIDD